MAIKRIISYGSPDKEGPVTRFEELKGVPVQAAKSFEDIATLGANLFGEPSMPGAQAELDLSTPEVSGLSNYLQNKLNVREEALHPTNLITSGLQKFARSAPTVAIGAATGGLPGALSAAQTTGIGALAGTAAQALGAPGLVQDIAQLGTEIGTGIYKGRIKTPRGAQELAYEEAKGLAPKGYHVAHDVHNNIMEVEDILSKTTSRKPYKDLSHALDILKNKSKSFLVGPEGKPLSSVITYNDALDLRRSLGNTYKVVDEVAQPAIEQLRKSLNKFFAYYSAENPKFFKALKKADQLTDMVNMKSILGDFTEFISNKALPLKFKFDGKDLNLGAAASHYLGQMVSQTIGLLDKGLMTLAKNPAGRDYLLKTANAIIKEDPTLALKYILKLKDLFPEYYSEEPSFKVHSMGS